MIPTDTEESAINVGGLVEGGQDSKEVQHQTRIDGLPVLSVPLLVFASYPDYDNDEGHKRISRRRISLQIPLNSLFDRPSTSSTSAENKITRVKLLLWQR